jgi:hypothetical protein
MAGLVPRLVCPKHLQPSLFRVHTVDGAERRLQTFDPFRVVGAQGRE